MAYNTSLSSAISFFNSESIPSIQTRSRIFARVTDVVLDSSHRDFNLFGKTQAINGIRYRVLNDNEEIPDSTDNDPFAFCGEVGLKNVPLIDEIVEIVFQPSNSIESDSYDEKAYYIKPVGIWNNTHHNALPEKNQNKTEAVLGDNVIERSDIASLQPFSGDTYIEGRLGQSLRFSGYKHPKNILTDDSNNGDPFGIIRIGQKQNTDSFENYIEDINLDPTSIYLTSNHTVPINLSSNKQETYREEPPQQANTFQGNQIIVNSGRLILHSKNDHLLLNSKLSVGISSLSTNIDSISYISLDSPKIYLGAKATEPVVRGNKNLKVLSEIIDILKRMSSNFALATDPAKASAQLVATAGEITPLINQIQLSPTLSTKAFTE